MWVLAPSGNGASFLFELLVAVALPAASADAGTAAAHRALAPRNRQSGTPHELGIATHLVGTTCAMRAWFRSPRGNLTCGYAIAESFACVFARHCSRL